MITDVFPFTWSYRMFLLINSFSHTSHLYLSLLCFGFMCLSKMFQFVDSLSHKLISYHRCVSVSYVSQSFSTCQLIVAQITFICSFQIIICMAVFIFHVVIKDTSSLWLFYAQFTFILILHMALLFEIFFT